MAAAVLQVATLAGGRVEQRPKAVVRGGGRRRRHPKAAKQAVADLEVELALEAHVGGAVREGVGVDRLLRGSGTAGKRLELLRPAEVGGRRDHRLDARPLLRRPLLSGREIGRASCRERGCPYG